MRAEIFLFLDQATDLIGIGFRDDLPPKLLRIVFQLAKPGWTSDSLWGGNFFVFGDHAFIKDQKVKSDPPDYVKVFLELA
jgi:hypothetical protein